MIQTTPSRRFEFLDGLPGIAALAVILFHFNGTLKDHGVFVAPAPLDFLYGLGRYGVQIFFVLSGFVIAYSLRYEKITSLFCLRFFLKRSIRLDPPYWLIVALMVGLSFFGHQIADIWSATFLMILSLTMTFLSAHVFYYFIEAPSLRMSQKIKMKWNLTPQRLEEP